MRSNVSEQANFTQVYVYDADEQLQRRISLISHLKRETITKLQNVVHQNNVYTRKLITAWRSTHRDPSN
ncbi:unnamed protein product [Absidia cylindrospora]